MFISKLGDLMRQKGVNQTELSQATGLTPTTIRKFLRGPIDRLDVATVEALIGYFELTSINQLVESDVAVRFSETAKPPGENVGQTMPALWQQFCKIEGL